VRKRAAVFLDKRNCYGFNLNEKSQILAAEYNTSSLVPGPPSLPTSALLLFPFLTPHHSQYDILWTKASQKQFEIRRKMTCSEYRVK
jgi:hypothetical protein